MNDQLPPWRRTLDNGNPYWTKNYQEGVPATIELPTQPLCEILDRAVSEAGSRVATVFMDGQLTYAELGDQVSRAAHGLYNAGVRQGDRVAVLLPNSPQHLIAFWAIMRLGAVIVEHNPLYTARELEEIFADHGAQVAIAMDRVIPTLEQLSDGVRPRTIIGVDITRYFSSTMQRLLSLPIPKLRKQRAQLTNGNAGDESWESLLSHGLLDPDVPRPVVDDLAAIQYTSGTTGRPKGAMLTHFNLYANARQGELWYGGIPKGKQTLYAVLPFFHAFGITVHMTNGVLLQSRQVLFPKPDVKLILKAAKKYPPTIFNAVPVLYQKTAEGAHAQGTSLETCKWCISGAMALPEKVRVEWEAATRGRVVEGYGLTESAPVALGNPFSDRRRSGTIGVPFPSTLMKVVAMDDPSREVGVGEPGELMIAGPQVFQGYWNQPEATAAVLTDDGWLHTGDVVTVDEDGFTTIVDRLKSLIITGGFNIAPREVEDVLVEHPDIAEAAVVGLASDRGDEQVAAVLVAKPGHAIDTTSVRRFAREKLTAYKVPRTYLVVSEIPRNAMGKVVAAEVKALFTQE